MNFEQDSIRIAAQALAVLEQGFANLPTLEQGVDTAKMEHILADVAERMHDNYPYQHPLYAGQMLKPPHPIARAAYMLALWINPNNHALDGGRASSAMEKEAVAALATMFGWQQHLGHLCGGGTMANLEALWVAGKLHPGKTIVASNQAHYTHSRITEVLGLPFASIPTTPQARMDIEALEDTLKTGAVGTVVVTLGTTGTGSVDPLPGILALREKYEFRIHADTAYGGYFALANHGTTATQQAFKALQEVDSLVIDPHKHGLQPYGCGCVLFRNPEVGRLYKHDSPYTYFSSNDLHLGEISLECSRPGAAAVALWATQQYFPLERGGEFAHNLGRSLQAAQKMYEHLAQHDHFLTLFPPDLDIVLFAPKAQSTSRISQLSQEFFQRTAVHNLHLALFNFPTHHVHHLLPDITVDSEYITCLRSCLMKPEHLDWVDTILALLETTRQELGTEKPV